MKVIQMREMGEGEDSCASSVFDESMIENEENISMAEEDMESIPMASIRMMR